MEHLTDAELRLLQSALRRGLDPLGVGHDVPVTEEEWEAHRTLQRHYEKLSEGSTDD